MEKKKSENWKDEYTSQVYLLALSGVTETRMAELWGISLKTFQIWKETKPEFLKALKDGSVLANIKIAEHFFLKCTDRYVDTEDILIYNGEVKKIPVRRFIQGDKWAQARWLAIHDRQNWSETKKEDTSKIDLSEISTEDLKKYQEIHSKTDVIETKKLFKVNERYGGISYIIANNYGDAECKFIKQNGEKEIEKIECLENGNCNSKYLIL